MTQQVLDREDLPEGFFMNVNHYHDSSDEEGLARVEIRSEAYHGNDTVEVTPRYATEAVIVDKEGLVVATGAAVCSPLDTPCRKRGYLIATRRCMKNFWISQQKVAN